MNTRKPILYITIILLTLHGFRETNAQTACKSLGTTNLSKVCISREYLIPIYPDCSTFTPSRAGALCWDSSSAREEIFNGSSWIPSDSLISKEIDANNDGTAEIGINSGNAFFDPASSGTCKAQVLSNGTIDVGCDGTADLSENGARGLGDSTSTAVFCGDTNGDGTLKLTELKICIEAVPAYGTAWVGAGHWTGGFRTQINITAAGVSVIGFGRGSTTIEITGGCNGDSDALDNGDSNIEFLSLFKVQADRFRIAHMTLDGGSTRTSGTRLDKNDAAFCDINDVDGDGTANSSDATPGGTCSGKWCPLDSHFVVNVSNNVERVVFEDIEFKNADRMAVVNQPGTEKIEVYNCSFTGMGEHSVNTKTGSLIVMGSQFRWCGQELGYCIGLSGDGVNIESPRIIGNRFEQCAGACVNTEVDSEYIRGAAISGNVFINLGDENGDGTIDTPQVGPAISLLGGQSTVDLTGDGTVNTSDIVHVANTTITGNTIRSSKTAEEAIVLTSVGSISDVFTGVVISGNAISYAPKPEAAQHYAIRVDYADGVSLTNNTVDITGDGTNTSDRYERGIYISHSKHMKIDNNQIRGLGDGVVGLQYNLVSDSSASFNQVIDSTSTNGLYGLRVYDSDRIQLIGNLSEGWDQGFRIEAGSTKSRITKNQCESVTRCVVVESSGTPTVDTIISDNEARTCSSWCWYDATSGGRNIWLRNLAFDGYVSSGAVGSSSPNILSGAGSVWACDENSDGQTDATCALWIIGDTVQVLDPTDAPPSCGSSNKGAIYYDDSLGELCDCDGTSWAQVDGGGGC